MGVRPTTLGVASLDPSASADASLFLAFRPRFFFVGAAAAETTDPDTTDAPSMEGDRAERSSGGKDVCLRGWDGVVTEETDKLDALRRFIEGGGPSAEERFRELLFGNMLLNEGGERGLKWFGGEAAILKGEIGNLVL